MASNPPTTDLDVPEAAAAAAAPAPAHSDDLAPSLPSVHNNPPYSEMITEAITSLNERHGSSKRAITEYIEARYPNLPPNHSSLLDFSLNRLRDDGQISMVRESYKLTRSAVAPDVSANGADSVGQKRRPGRPPKRKPVQAALPVFGEPSASDNLVQNAAIGPLVLANVPADPAGGPVVGTPRGRGRPPKQGGAKRGRGRPPSISGGVQATAGGSRGRPRKIAAAPVVAGTGRRPGRPRKVAYVDGGVAAVDGETSGSTAVAVSSGGASGAGPSQVTGKRRGRPSKAVREVVKKARKLSGKPLGRPKKTETPSGSQTPLNPQQIVSLDLKGKLQYFQSRMKQTVSIIKPLLNIETAVTALQELETLADMDVNASSNIPPQS